MHYGIVWAGVTLWVMFCGETSLAELSRLHFSRLASSSGVGLKIECASNIRKVF